MKACYLRFCEKDNLRTKCEKGQKEKHRVVHNFQIHHGIKQAKRLEQDIEFFQSNIHITSVNSSLSTLYVTACA